MDDERRNALTVAQMARLLDCSEEVVINDTRLRQCPPSLERRWALFLYRSATRRDGQGWSESGYDVSHIMDGLYGESLRIKYVAIENGLRSINVSLSVRQSDISDKPEAIPHVTHSEKEDT